MEPNITVQENAKDNIVNLAIIQRKIYNIIGVKVMLDFDLAEMYQIE